MRWAQLNTDIETATLKQTQRRGFTIVELLIVIVVIAILAAISVVAYTGIQNRANNTATITAVNHTVKAIPAYIALNGTYPSTASRACIVPTSSETCTNASNTASSVSSLTANLQSVASIPTQIKSAHPDYDGIAYNYGWIHLPRCRSASPSDL